MSPEIQYKSIPRTTDTHKFFVFNATRNTGSAARINLGSKPIFPSGDENNIGKTIAAIIAVGMKCNALLIPSGNDHLVNNASGIKRGKKVTAAMPAISNRMLILIRARPLRLD